MLCVDILGLIFCEVDIIDEWWIVFIGILGVWEVVCGGGVGFGGGDFWERNS